MGTHWSLFDDAVILLDPLGRLGRVDEGEGQGADAEARRHANGLALRAGYPQRRMRSLHGLRHDVPAWHLEVLPLVAGVRIHREHVADVLDGLEEDPALPVHRNLEAAEFEFRRRLAGAELDAPVGDEVEGRDHLRRAGGVVVAGDDLADAVAEADVLRALRAGCEKDLWRGRVRVLLEKVVFHLPGEIDPEPVGNLDLFERVVEELLLDAVAPCRGS